MSLLGVQVSCPTPGGVTWDAAGPTAGGQRAVLGGGQQPSPSTVTAARGGDDAGVKSPLRRAAVRHLDAATATHAARLAVGHDPDRLDNASGRKALVEVLLRGSQDEVAHNTKQGGVLTTQVAIIARSCAPSAAIIQSWSNGEDGPALGAWWQRRVG